MATRLRVRIGDDEHTTTTPEFIADNREGLSAEQLSELIFLRPGESIDGGGGASPLWSVTAIDQGSREGHEAVVTAIVNAFRAVDDAPLRCNTIDASAALDRLDVLVGNATGVEMDDACARWDRERRARRDAAPDVVAFDGTIRRVTS